MLGQARQGIQQSIEGLGAVESQALTLHTSMLRVDDLQQRIDAKLEDVNEILNSLYDGVLADIAAQFADKDAVGMTPVRDRTLKSWKALDDIYNATAAAEVQFWQGRGKYGAAAADVFHGVEAQVAEQRDNLDVFLGSGLVVDAETVEKYMALSGHLSEYSVLIKDFSDEWNRSTGINDAVALAANGLLDTFDGLDSLTSRLSAESTEDVNKKTTTVESLVTTSVMGAGITLVVSVIVGGLLAIFITRSIVNPITSVIASLSLSEKIIDGAASQISAAARDLSEGVTAQASQLESTASALEQVSAMTKASAENAKTTNGSTVRASELVRSGAVDMKEMSAAMSKINEQADRIGNIIKTIEEISFQTNLLALNAAVEAARAGEAGKGFAVVADEVRNLSGRSAQAAKDTTELITATVESVRSGSGILGRLSESYGEIESGIDGIHGLIGQIASASEEQSHGVEQINAAVSKMTGITQQNAAGAEESAASAQDLEGQITNLVDNIDMLRSLVSGENISSGATAPAGIRKGGKETVPPSRQLSGPMAANPSFVE
jgi:methyl-accepting chemotaxis protein